jgi:hypothetical protein
VWMSSGPGCGGLLLRGRFVDGMWACMCMCVAVGGCSAYDVVACWDGGVCRMGGGGGGVSVAGVRLGWSGLGAWMKEQENVAVRVVWC